MAESNPDARVGKVCDVCRKEQAVHPDDRLCNECGIGHLKTPEEIYG